MPRVCLLLCKAIESEQHLMVDERFGPLLQHRKISMDREVANYPKGYHPTVEHDGHSEKSKKMHVDFTAEYKI